MSAAKDKGSGPAELLRSLMPIAGWLPRYQRTWLRADVMAGLAVWAMTVPQALAYAGIAGVPPIYGLYAVPIAMAAYAVFGTVGGLATGDLGQAVALTALLAFVVGVMFLLFGLLRLGWAASFLAQPVLQGFTQGIALTVMVGQASAVFGTEGAVAKLAQEARNLPGLVGLEVDHAGFVVQAWALLSTLGQTHVPTAAVGVTCLVVLFAFRRFRPQAPSALIAVLLAVLAVSLLGLQESGVRVIGKVETGMISLSLPAIDLQAVAGLLPGAFAIVLLGYSVSLSVAKVGAQKTGEEIEPNQELVALGMANLGAAFSSGFVVCGSLSRGSVITRAGGRTQVVSLINAALVVLTLVLVLPLFFRLPMATLSAVVIAAMYGLLDFGYLRRLLRTDRGEFACAMAALLGVLLLGILQGVALGVVLALAVLIRRVSRPGTAVLGCLPGTDSYRDVAAHPEAETSPGLLIFRFDAPVIFANAAYFADEVRRCADEAAAPVREVLVMAQQINQLDSTGADQLARLHGELRAKGIGLSFAEVKGALHEAMRRTGLEDEVGADHIYDTIERGVQAFLSKSAMTNQIPGTPGGGSRQND
jgi:high affinity sulfate transporter 1